MLFLLFALALAPQAHDLPMKVIAQGPLSDIATARQVVVRDAEAWQKLWQAHGVTKLPPKVDFDQRMVVGVFLGTRPSSGYQVGIDRAYLDGADLVVDYVVHQPGPGTMTAPVMTAPYILVILPSHTGPVRFVDTTAAHARRR
ncbi:MAG TPA: protease complex subunit PrcB family protein [Vicinamibacterales bacterium]|nr:protease complex subunit PrcB family protein [Vicinamibacterales bacterium]